MSNIKTQVNDLIDKAAKADDCDAAMRFSQAALNAAHASQVLESGPDDTDALVKHMVDRFLSWRLPEDFHPDCGISFKAAHGEGTAYPDKYEPVGTNLFTATQATAMVRHMLDGRS